MVSSMKSFSCRISGDLLNENKMMGVHAYIVSGFLSWGRKFFRLEEGFLDVWLRRSLRSPW
jgi:hypothetical protein